MEGMFADLYNLIITTINNLGIFGPLLGSLFIVLESMIPPLPLFVFITINYLAYGHLFGFLISWICTIIGCVLSYFLVKNLIRNRILKWIKDGNLLNKCLSYIENLSTAKITVILAIPFTPAFMMNIAAGLSNMNFRKFLTSVIIGKIFLVFFWGNIGTSLVESFKHPESLLAIAIMLILAYLISLAVEKIFKVE